MIITYDRMGLRVYWELCGRYSIKRASRWCEEVPDDVQVSSEKNYEIWWDRTGHTAHNMDHNRPDGPHKSGSEVMANNRLQFPVPKTSGLRKTKRHLSTAL